MPDFLDNPVLVDWLGLAIQALLLLSIVVAYLSYRHSLRAQKRAHTIAVMSALNTTVILEEANWCAIGLRNQPEKRCLSDLSEYEERCLVRLLNFYEFVCTSLADRVLDATTVRHLRGGAMAEFYGLVRKMIQEWRDRTGRRELYTHFERFSEDYLQGTVAA